MSKKVETAEHFRNELLESIELQMQKKELSQGDVAKTVGVDRRNINGIMTGSRSATLEYLIKIAEVVGLKVSLNISEEKD